MPNLNEPLLSMMACYIHWLNPILMLDVIHDWFFHSKEDRKLWIGATRKQGMPDQRKLLCEYRNPMYGQG